MTLLHLASALGYSKLVCTMLTWRSENPSLILETEIDALSQDNMGYTPLVCVYLLSVRICNDVVIEDVDMCTRSPRNSIYFI